MYIHIHTYIHIHIFTNIYTAAVPTAGLVAFAALRAGNLPESEDGSKKKAKVAVLGASRGVGTFAVQVKFLKCQVYGDFTR